MATTVDTLITDYKMHNADYLTKSDQVVGATFKVGRAIGQYGIPILTKFATAILGVASAYASLAIYSSGKAAEFDALTKALESVVGGAEEAKRAMEELQDIAKLPGLGLSEAIQGYTALRRAGLDDSLSMRTIRSAGNANALASGGREELNRILLAISQIALKPNLSGEELMQLNEAGIPASKIINAKYGTSDGGELKKLGVSSKEALQALVDGMEDLPEAMGSAKNSIENLQMAVEMAVIGIGTGINSGILPSIDKFTAALEDVNKNGLFEIFGQKLAELVDVAFPGIMDSSDTLEGVFVDLAATGADVAQMLVNFKLNMSDIINFFAKFLPGSGIGAGIKLTEGKGGLTAGDQVRAEYDARTYARSSESKSKRAKARGFANVAEMEAYDDARKKKDAAPSAPTSEDAKAFEPPDIPLLRRIADATEKNLELNRATIGQSTVGEGAANAVSLSKISGTHGYGAAGDRVVAAIADMVSGMSHNRARKAF
jgi:tape measure domain-containing protein